MEGPIGKDRLGALNESGRRIKRRLLDLVDEYDEFIRKCTHVMDGMTLATQMVRMTTEYKQQHNWLIYQRN